MQPEKSPPSGERRSHGPYEYNVGKFLADHQGYVLSAGPGGYGYAAQRRNDQGYGVGESVIEATLDELHVRLQEQQQAP